MLSYCRIAKNSIKFVGFPVQKYKNTNITQMFSVFSVLSALFMLLGETLQEGQHPLTGKRAPPISGGTYRRRRTLIDGYLESPFPTACLL